MTSLLCCAANTPAGSAKSSSHAPGRVTAVGLIALAITAAAGIMF
jgi:hypothetical protein